MITLFDRTLFFELLRAATHGFHRVERTERGMQFFDLRTGRLVAELTDHEGNIYWELV